MTPEERQRIFDAINTSIDTHARELPESVRLSIATDAALKIAERTEGRAEWPSG